MSIYSGKKFKLSPTAVVTPITQANKYITARWEYFTDFAKENSSSFGEYLVDRYIKQFKLTFEAIKKNLENFTIPIWALDDIITFISLVVSVGSDVLGDGATRKAKELLALAKKYMIIRDTENNCIIPTKDFIKAAVEEVTDNYADMLRELINEELFKIEENEDR